MDTASNSLKEYIARALEESERELRTSCDQFVAGIAAYMAVQSWLDWFENEKKGRLPAGGEILDIAAAPNSACWDYAHFFAGGVVAKDPAFGRTFSLAVTLAGVFRRVWPEENRDDWLHGDWAAELGWYIASEADGSGVSWEDDGLNPHGLKYPGLECCSEDWFVPEEEP